MTEIGFLCYLVSPEAINVHRPCIGRGMMINLLLKTTPTHLMVRYDRRDLGVHVCGEPSFLRKAHHLLCFAVGFRHGAVAFQQGPQKGVVLRHAGVCKFGYHVMVGENGLWVVGDQRERWELVGGGSEGKSHDLLFLGCLHWYGEAGHVGRLRHGVLDGVGEGRLH